MVYKDQTILAVVPARGGSKSIPRKNLCKVCGVSLVGRAAQIASSIEWIDHRIISTDDKEIAKEAAEYSLDVPFMRPDELAGDLATSIDMWRHAWIESEKHYGKRFDISILLEPTSPLRRSEDIRRTIETLIEGNHEAAVTVSAAPAHFTPHKCLTVDNDGHVGFYLRDGADYSIRQKIPDYYYRNGICYALKRETLIEKGYIFGKDTAAVIIDRPVVNIDEPYEIELAEFFLKREGSCS